MYIVFWKFKECGEKERLDIGYLPFMQIPKESILREAIFSGDYDLTMKSGALLGIYQDKELADEHQKLESAWRTRDQLWVEFFRRPRKRR